MDTLILYVVVVVLFGLSFVKAREKTKKALVKGLKAFENIMPQFITVLILIAIMLTVLDPKTISQFLGAGTGWIGGVMQIAMFVSSLMIFGIVTLPMIVAFVLSFPLALALMPRLQKFFQSKVLI